MRRAAFASLIAIALVMPAGHALATAPGVPPGTVATGPWYADYSPDLAIDGDQATWWNAPDNTGQLVLTFPERLWVSGATLLTKQSGESYCARHIWLNVPTPEENPIQVAESYGDTQPDQVLEFSWVPVETDTLVIWTWCASTWTAYREVGVDVASFHFDFSGFLAPVDNGVMNVAKAGSAIPVKFGLGGDQGLDIFAAGYPKVVPIGCSIGEPFDQVEEYVAASTSGLQYEAGADRYQYNWKTQKGITGCYQLKLGLKDGSVHTADFRLK